MQTVGLILPEFHPLWHQQKSPPMGGTGHIFILKGLGNVGETLIQNIAVRQDLGLQRRMRPHLAFPRARCKIGIRYSGVCFPDYALDTDLQTQAFPVKTQAGKGADHQILGFGAVVIGEKGKTIVIHLFHQNDPAAGAPLMIHCAEIGRIGVIDFGCFGLLIPVLKEGKGTVGLWDHHGYSLRFCCKSVVCIHKRIKRNFTPHDHGPHDDSGHRNPFAGSGVHQRVKKRRPAHYGGQLAE